MLAITFTAFFAVFLAADAVPTPTNNKGTLNAFDSLFMLDLTFFLYLDVCDFGFVFTL